MDRYLSQRLYKNIGKSGQAILKNSSVAIIGLGALGTVCADLLARAGVSSILLVDRDYVELTNLQRQTLYDESDVGRPKAAAAKERLEKINSEIRIEARSEDINSITCDQLGRPDLVIAATDNMESRLILNDYCVKNGIPLVYGGAVEDLGSVFTFIPGGPCLRCIFHGSTEGTCDNSGIISSCSSIIGSMMAGAAIKTLIKKQEGAEFLHLNAWTSDLSKITVKKDPACPACNGKFQYLGGEIKTKVITLCGNGTYHINGNKKDLTELARRLSKIGEVKRLGNVIHFKDITLFDDGRAIIKAPTEKQAKSLYSRYVGN
jgi:adenylyltransferase/sulfurtransferase